MKSEGYKPNKISTIVDAAPAAVVASLAINQTKFLLL